MKKATFVYDGDGRKMKRECVIFLSWQSDRKDCRNFVLNVAEKLQENLDNNILTVQVDRNTCSVPGAPDIGNTIFEKIDKCDLFIADLTLVNDPESGYRKTPNPNVLIELGYAVKALKWDHIILLQCIDYGGVEDLPFDVNHRRVCKFTVGNNTESEEEREKKRSDSKKVVLGNIVDTIRLLYDKNELFGGKRGKIPKFELYCCGYDPFMSNIILTIKNVSLVYISNLKIQSFQVVFDGEKTEHSINIYALLEKKSFGLGESTKVYLHNGKLGAGEGYTNSVWKNYAIVIRFLCENEDSEVFYFETRKHIQNVDLINMNEQWEVQHIEFFEENTQ